MQILSKHLEFCKKKKGKTKLLLSHCLCLSFSCSWASHPDHILLQSHISWYILVMSLGAICICVCFFFLFYLFFIIIPCQCVTEVVALNNTWLCHSIHCMDQWWGFRKLYQQHKRFEKIVHGHASTSTLCFWCKCTKSLRKTQYDCCMQYNYTHERWHYS